MEINSAFSSGVSGFQKASQQITESSERIANQTVQGSEISTTTPTINSSREINEPVTTELINMKLAEMQAKASTQVISTADEMVGSLIDVSV